MPAVPKPKTRRMKIKPRWEGFVAPKIERIHDPDHVKAVRGLPCCACAYLGEKQRTKTEAHHTTTRGAFGGDNTVAPLCRTHHQQWHVLGRKTFKQRFGLDVAVIARDLWKYRNGRGQ